MRLPLDLTSNCELPVIPRARGSWPLVGCTLALTWGSSAPALAQAPEGLETVTVTGTRVPGSDPQIGSVTVIDRRAITERNDGNIFDLLRDVPGIHVSLPGGRGNLGSIFVRGAEPNYGAVLVDGIQVNDPTNTRGGSFDFSTLNIDSVERIEVLRGPQSSIYGSDGLSGVINVITLSGTPMPTASADLEVGSHDFSRAGVTLSGPARGDGTYSVRLGGINEGHATDPAEFRSHSLAGKLTTRPGDRFDLSVVARHAEADASAFPDDSGGDRLAVNREKARRDTRDSSLGFEARSVLTPRTTLHVGASQFGHDEQVLSPAVVPGLRDGIPENRGSAEFSRTTVNVFASSRVTDSLQAAYGIGYQRDDGRGSSLLTLGPQRVLPASYRLEREHRGVYGELSYRTDGLALSAALRVDDTDAAGTVDTAKVALSYETPGRPVRLHASWGEGFKLPSLFALGDPLVGNPALRPEKGDNRELGMRSTHLDGRLRWSVTVFDQRFAELIDFDAASFSMLNRSHVNIAGAELSAELRAGEQWLIQADFTRVDIDVRDTRIELRHRPKHTGRLAVEWRPIRDVWSAHLGVHYVGHRPDSSVPTGALVLPGYHRVDLAVNRSLRSGIALSLAIDNLTDERFEPAIGFPDPGRRVRASIRATIERF